MEIELSKVVKNLKKKFLKDTKKPLNLAICGIATILYFPENHKSVDKSSGETAHIERFNNTIRQRLARYTRKTLAFSKSDYWHDLVTRLFIIHYNLSLRI